MFELLYSFVCGIENYEIDIFYFYDDEFVFFCIILVVYKNIFYLLIIDFKKLMNDILKNIFELMNIIDIWKVI